MANQRVKKFITSAKSIAPLLIASGFLIGSSGYAAQTVTPDLSLKDTYLALNVAENYYGLPSYQLIPSEPVAPKTPGSSFLRELTLAQRPNFEENTGDAPLQDTEEDPNLVPLTNSRQKLLLEDETIGVTPSPVAGEKIDAVDATGQKVQLLPIETEQSLEVELPTAAVLPPIPASNATLVNPEAQIILPPPPKPQETAKTPFVVEPPPAPPVQVVTPVVVPVPEPAPVVQYAPVVQEPVIRSTYVEPERVVTPVRKAVRTGGGGSYVVKRGDTLNQISALVKSSKLTPAQKLVALYNRNPSAFLGENMNRMIVGSRMSFSGLDNYPTNEIARKEVASQYASYLALFDTNKTGVKAMTNTAKAKKAPVGKMAPKADVVNVPKAVEPPASAPVIETRILPSTVQASQSSVEVMPAEKSNGRSITIALVALILAALGGYVFLRIRSRNRIPLD